MLDAPREWLTPVSTFKIVTDAFPVPIDDRHGVLLYEQSDYCQGIIHYALADNGRWVNVCMIMLDHPNDTVRHLQKPTIKYNWGDS